MSSGSSVTKSAEGADACSWAASGQAQEGAHEGQSGPGIHRSAGGDVIAWRTGVQREPQPGLNQSVVWNAFRSHGTTNGIRCRRALWGSNLLQMIGTSIRTYSCPKQTTSTAVHTCSKFTNNSAVEHNERCSRQHAMLGSTTPHTTLLCGTATAIAIVTAHREPAIAACDPQPTTTESCFLHLERRRRRPSEALRS